MKIELNEAHLKILIEALDSYSRLRMFQFHQVLSDMNLEDKFDIDGNEIKPQTWHRFIDKIADLKAAMLNTPRNACHSIGSDKISDNAKIAYEIQQVLMDREHILKFTNEPLVKVVK